jgi:hypothetical protein
MENGLYKAEYVPRVAGVYTVHVKLLDTDISGSPYSLTVLPGEISSSKTYTTVIASDLEVMEAGNTYLFDL